MKQKLKMFYECMKPNIALLMVTILVVSLLSVGMVEETKAADLGGRTNWLDADNVKGKVFEEKGVTTQDSYTEYVLKDGEYVPNTVSINSAAELGSRENPYAIESEEDLILFGQLSGKEYPEKYFLLTKKEYDMQGDKKYMIPLFPGVVAPSMPPDTGFQGNLIGNQAIIKNAYIVNKVNNTTYYAGLFSSLYEDAVIWDLNLENAIYQVEHDSSCKIGGLAGECPSNSRFRIMNCNLSYTVNYLSPYPMYFYGLCGGYPNAYNCNVILKDINSNAALTIQAVAKMYSNTIQNCTSTITKDGFGFTISENTLTESPSFQLSTEETTYATINIPSSGYIYREGNKIYAPGNQLVLNRNGAFEFHDETKEIKINDVACDAAATYNTVQLDYNDETTDTIIYPAGETYKLPVPEKEECEFLGWTNKDMEEPTTNVELGADFVGACTYIANWITDINTCDITFVDGNAYTYAGKEIKPVVLVEYDGVLLSQGDDFEVSYSNNVNAATMDSENAPTIVVEGIGDYTGSKTLTFTIEKATPLIQTMPIASKIQEGDSLSASTLTGGVAVSGIATNDIYGSSVELVEGTFSWKDGTIIPTLADSGVTKYTVVFTPNDTNNFNTFEFGISVLVEKKSSTTEPGSGSNNPDSGNTGTQKPGSGETGAEKPVTQPQVGESVNDSKNTATYKVTSSEKNSVEVAYVAPMKDAKNVTIPETVTLKDNTVAKVTSIDAGAFKKNTKIQSVSIGKNVETIGNDAFNGCKNLKKVKIAKNVTKIGKNAFANCKKLTSVTLGSNLTTISEKAFYKCTSLKKITIPKKVNSIGKSAFEGCKNLKTVNIKTTKLTKKNVKKNAFKGTSSKAKFDVPNSKKKTYASILKARGASKKATIK